MTAGLPSRLDAFGHAISDWLAGVHEPDLVERDDGFIETGAGPDVYLAPFDAWLDAERQAMRFVRGRVVDVGCGAGRMSLFLQESGHDVFGLDISPLAIRASRERGLQRTAVGSIEEVDVSGFDTILLLGNNFGLFGSAPRARRLLRKWSADDDGPRRIIAGSMDPYRAVDPIHVAYRRRNRRRGRMPGQNRLRIRYRQYATPWSDYLFASRPEIRAIVREGGWEIRRILDSRSNRALYVAVIERRSV